MRIGKVMIIVIVYVVSIGVLVWMLSSSVRERFEDIQRRTYVVDEARCVECMTFFQDVFQFTEAAQIVPYVQQRVEFLKYILRQFLIYNDTGVDTCLAQKGDGEKSLQDLMGCFNELIGELVQQCQDKGVNRAECAIIQKLNDRAFQKALLCGANECSISEFRERYKAEVNSIAQDLLACGEAFANDSDLCVKMYARIMEAKKAVPTENATPGDAVVTQSELKAKMGEMTAFVMMN